jgi:hypothetical protein
MEDKFPCLCGHPFEMHYDPDDESSAELIYGSGKCQAEIIPEGQHHCSSCGYDPDDYCPCLEFKANNLLYLEEKSRE